MVSTVVVSASGKRKSTISETERESITGRKRRLNYHTSVEINKRINNSSLAIASNKELGTSLSNCLRVDHSISDCTFNFPPNKTTPFPSITSPNDKTIFPSQHRCCKTSIPSHRCCSKLISIHLSWLPPSTSKTGAFPSPFPTNQSKMKPSSTTPSRSPPSTSNSGAFPSPSLPERSKMITPTKLDPTAPPFKPSSKMTLSPTGKELDLLVARAAYQRDQAASYPAFIEKYANLRIWQQKSGK